LRHMSTGFTVNAVFSPDMPVQLGRRVPPGDVPDGAAVRMYGRVDSAKHIAYAGGGVVVEHPSANDFKADADGGRTITGYLRKISYSGSERNFWITTDRTAVYVLASPDGTIWRLMSDTVTPSIVWWQAGNVSDLCPARFGEFTIKLGAKELVSATLTVWPAGSELPTGMNRCQGAGASGATAAQLAAGLQAMRVQHDRIADSLAKLMPVTMTISPELARVGEPVRLEMRALADHLPNANATLFSDYFHTDRKEPLVLNWQAGEKVHGLTVYTASAIIPTGKVGQYRVEWNCDIGGDIDTYCRSMAVCDDSTAVCLFQITSPGTPRPQVDFHKDNVPFDYWEGATTKFGMWGQAAPEAWAALSHDARQFGDNPGFLLEHFGWGSAQLRNDPPDVQRVCISGLKEAAPLLGFEGYDISCWSYTMGNVAYKLIHEAQGLTVTSLCTECHVDGSMEINAWGKPERPYFMAKDDFRKAGPGGASAIVAFSQVQRQTYLARHYSCDYCIEPATMGGALAGSVGRAATFDDIAASRILDFYEGMFRMARCQHAPYVIAQGIEFNGSRPGATEGNRRVLQYAVEKAKAGKVVFSTTRGVTGYYQRHYTKTPETTNYEYDYWAGFSPKGETAKPTLVPDTMSMENAEFYALALHGEILPFASYDYTAAWEYPDFGNETIPRRSNDSNSYIPANSPYKFELTPRTLDTRPFTVQRTDRTDGGAHIVTLVVEASKDCARLPLALWDIPREYRRDENWYHASEGCRFVPIQAPYTDNPNGFLVADVKKGRNVFTVRFTSREREPLSIDFDIGDGIHGRVITRGEAPMAYLWPTRPWKTAFEIDVPAGRSVQFYAAPAGERVDLAPGTHRLEIGQESWARLVGLTVDELRRGCREAIG